MSEQKLSTESYKGVRDFYPTDMAVQRYIFDIWSKTAESFGYERYDASILEPADLYKRKGAENTELVNEQTYTFIDRGEREVTLRPEMTPTVARLIAGRRRDLSFPVRWYSIPNLFRYERPQRGRLREHWQLNCDIFGADDYTADVEIIALAQQMLINFGATSEMFEIRLNNRTVMNKKMADLSILDETLSRSLLQLNDRKNKISSDDYLTQLKNIITEPQKVDALINFFDSTTPESDSSEERIINGLSELGIVNVKVDRYLARGFNYYTGTIFEIFDRSGENNRAMLGGGRYDNLTSMFGGDAITGIGFGMGDVTMQDFLRTHNLLPNNLIKTAATLSIIPTANEYNMDGQKLALQFRKIGIATTVDIGNKKIGKKISDAAEGGTRFALVLGPDEINSKKFTLKNLELETTETGTIESLSTYLQAHI